MTELWEAKKWLKRASAETTVGGEQGSTIVLEIRSQVEVVRASLKNGQKHVTTPTLSWPSRPKQP
jgi:hypothetical protein